MTGIYCAICRKQIDPAKGHIKLDAEEQGEPHDTPPRHDGYYLHYGCWESVSGGWMDPV